MSASVDERLCVLHTDALLDCQLSVAELHFGEAKESWKKSPQPRLSVLELTEDSSIVGRLVLPSQASNAALNWTLLEIEATPTLSSRLRSLAPSTSSETPETNDQHKIATLVLAVPRPKATFPHGGVSLMKALASKYMTSQELKDARYTDDASLASSGSSWQSATSTTVDQEGVQVIGAMGGKSIEFHKPRPLEEGFGAMTVNWSVCQQHPNASLHNSSICSFTDDSFVQLSLVGLKSLDLSANFLRSFSRDINPLLSATTNSLETLNLSSNPLVSLGADAHLLSAETLTFFESIDSWLSNASPTSSETPHLFIRFEASSYIPEPALMTIIPTLEITAPELFPARSLTTIVLNRTFISWNSFVAIVSSLPALLEAHACFNGWTSLSPEKISVSGRLLGSPTVRTLNLDGNLLVDFCNIASALESFTALSKLVLTSNPISNVPALELPATHPFSRARSEEPSAHHWSLSISSTHITDWTSVRNLSRAFPDLQEVRFQRNPMQLLTFTLPSPDTQDAKTAKADLPVTQLSDQVVRQYVVALCPLVTLVNGSKIGPMERKDAERLYLVHYFTAFATAELRNKASHPSEVIKELAKVDDAIARLWNEERESCVEAFERAHPKAGSSTHASASSSGLTLIDITVCDENAEFMMQKKLPASTSIAKLRSLVADHIAVSAVADRFVRFGLELMEPTFQGPPSFHPLTLEQSTLAQETSRLKATIILRSKV